MSGRTGDRRNSAEAFEFCGTIIEPGSEGACDLPVSRSSANHPVMLPVRILHGSTPGPVLFVSACIHGDEITGVEIIRQLLQRVNAETLAGTLIAIPIVNIFGFVANSRYLPDRRDLNRSFPGSAHGSLAARLAWLLRTEIIGRADFGIDLHSASQHRYNLPQVRLSPDAPRARQLADAFSPPAVIVSPLREKSMRATALEKGVEMLVYEAGEALRFDDFSLRVGVNGILRVMATMEMLQLKERAEAIAEPVFATKSLWLRAPRGGIARLSVDPGEIVDAGATVATVANPVGNEEEAIVTPISGIVIGLSRLGVVNQGDALIHIAELGDRTEPLDEATEARLAGAMLDEDELL